MAVGAKTQEVIDALAVLAAIEAEQGEGAVQARVEEALAEQDQATADALNALKPVIENINAPGAVVDPGTDPVIEPENPEQV